jgi:hypothetical protein
MATQLGGTAVAARPYGLRTDWELLRESALAEPEFEGLGEGESFTVQFGHVPPGHERVTALAARGLPGLDVKGLVAGVRRVDVGSSFVSFVPAMVNQIRPSQQRRHALRGKFCEPIRQALREIRGHLSDLWTRAIQQQRQGAARTATGWIGEALHLIQDSYSDAHIWRIRGATGRYPIVYIRYFGLQGAGAPLEHHIGRDPDPRDLVAGPVGGLSPTAARARDASREFLTLWLRRRAASTGATDPGLLAFMEKHLSLSPHALDPSHYYYRCRL